MKLCEALMTCFMDSGACLNPRGSLCLGLGINPSLSKAQMFILEADTGMMSAQVSEFVTDFS